MIDRQRATHAFPFLATISRDAADAFFERSVAMSLEHKQVLVRAGASCTHLPLVLEGTLRVFKSSDTGRELTLYRIERGESCILTATCILNHAAFPALAEAEGLTEVALAPAELVSRFVEEYPEWRRFVFGLYAKRLDIMLTLVEEVAFRHIDSRTALFLVQNASTRVGTITRTHGEIAAELGTSREVVTRVLKDFQAEGLVDTLRGRIRILRRDELEKRASLV